MNQVFISYAKEDLEKVKIINSELKARGIKTWIDIDNTEPGEWKTQIERAIRKSRYFLLFISNVAIDKINNWKGIQVDEFEYAYKLVKSISKTQFTIIPIRLEECDRGDHAMQSFNQYDFFGNSFDSEFDRLIKDIGEDEKISEKDFKIKSLFNKSYLFFKQGNFNKPIEIYDKVIDFDNFTSGISSEATKMIGLNYSKLKDHHKAIDFLKKAIDKGSNFSSSHYYLGEEYFHIKNYDKAIDSFKKALISPDLKPWVENSAKKMIKQIKQFVSLDVDSRSNPYLNYFYADPKEIEEGEPTTLYWDVKKGDTVKLFSVYYKPPGLNADIEYVDKWIVNRKGLKKVFPKIYNEADTNNWSYFLLQIDDGAYYKTIHVKIKY